MLTYSVSKQNSLNEFVATTGDLQGFLTTICSTIWSPSIYKDDRRSIANFKESFLLVYDIDEGMDILDAVRLLQKSEFAFVVATTKSHQVEKGGLTADRFRVILGLSEPITDGRVYRHALRAVAELVGLLDVVDTSCLEPARMYYPCKEIYREGVGNRVTPEDYPPLETLVAPPANNLTFLPSLEPSLEPKGLLSRSTLEFLHFGAVPGTRHKKLVKALMDLKQNNYTEDEAREVLNNGTMPIDSHGDYQITDIYKNREAKYEPRLPDTPEGGYESDSDSQIVGPSQLMGEMYEYLEDTEKVQGVATGIEGLDKMLGGGFRQGQLEVIMAQAKVGKSSLFHQIQYNMVTRGEKIGYMSRELNPATEVLPNYLSIANQTNVWLQKPTAEIKDLNKKLLTSWDHLLYFMKGYGHVELDVIREWAYELKEQHDVKIIFIDHMHWLLEDSEDFKLAARLAKDLKHLAKELDICIVLIIQPTKIHPDQKLGLNTLRGGAAIGQALDTLLTLERHKCETANISKLTLTDARHKLAKPGAIYLQYCSVTTEISEAEVVPVEETYDREYKRLY